MIKKAGIKKAGLISSFFAPKPAAAVPTPSPRADLPEKAVTAALPEQSEKKKKTSVVIELDESDEFGEADEGGDDEKEAKPAEAGARGCGCPCGSV